MGSLSGGTRNFRARNIELAICLVWVLHWAAPPHMSPAVSSDTVNSNGGSYLVRSIHEELAADDKLSIDGLEVECREGAVVLRGRVASIRDRLAAEEIARDRVGVDRVVNELAVRADNSGHDRSRLAAVVDSVLAVNPYLPSGCISAAVFGDTVVLNGAVPGRFEKAQAERAVQAVSGVSAVRNRIAVVENIFEPDSAPLPVGDGGDPAVQAIIDSYYGKLGVKPELSLKLDTTTNLAAGWRDSLYLDPPETGGRPRVVNPETRYYEAFDFVGLGIFLIKKAFGWDKKKDKKKEKD